MGHFMSPDPSALAYADPTNPQRFNLYSYALNNPLRMIDPSGLVACFYGGAGDTPKNDQDASDYAQTDSDEECTKKLDSNGNGGGQVLRENTSVDVNENGSDAGDVTSSGGGSTALISLWGVPNPGAVLLHCHLQLAAAEVLQEPTRLEVRSIALHQQTTYHLLSWLQLVFRKQTFAMFKKH